ncbi:endonuclease/exonuclease/phosphatase family protein [Winogradskyella sp. 3972H.M.0a.05]|uniref:endonuclease/exonuclease/phosphatase family protein n=1 Tax=Winogradskyella sp. 3972H.M.0a.05 TaxID=2950277 RepID=UPI003398FEC0
MANPIHNDEKLTVAFYNLENLFDTIDDKHTNDNDFLPTSRKRWTQKRYDRKLYKLGTAISKIGHLQTDKLPVIVGLAEVENRQVIEDLLATKDLEGTNYGIVHYDSADERGIDVGLIYNEDYFSVESSETFSVYLEDDDGSRDYTRDILLVSGQLLNEKVHVIVNHWSSRRDGKDETSHKRMAAAKEVVEAIVQLRNSEEDPKIIVMGDFNDNPDNESIKYLVTNGNLFNPMDTVWSYDKGSQNHDFKWNLFDQILVSANFLNADVEQLRFSEADVFNEKFLTQYKGKYKGQPFRTFVGKKYKGGYSDHFPVYIILKT